MSDSVEAGGGRGFVDDIFGGFVAGGAEVVGAAGGATVVVDAASGEAGVSVGHHVTVRIDVAPSVG